MSDERNEVTWKAIALMVLSLLTGALAAGGIVSAVAAHRYETLKASIELRGLGLCQADGYAFMPRRDAAEQMDCSMADLEAAQRKARQR